ncbi:MAG: UvrD-helicase domain-containing protein, partial [Spirochaetales bacterium]|nr:UvrD-helicase domain-containing protein [Spirochaetales bacterium]
DTLRQERFDLQNKLKDIEKQRQEQLAVKGKFGSFDKYLDALGRLSSISRSRTDFERDILKATPEQQHIIDDINLTKDILVKGSAGTGKSLVLLKSLEKALKLQKEELDLSDKKKILLLTYTNTLTKYNTYLSEVMKIENPGEIVTTALGFLELKLQEIEKDAVLDFTLWFTWRKKFCPSFMNEYEFQNEVENFLWALDITKEEYLDEIISRKGMGKPLQKNHREEVWESKIKIESLPGPGYTRSSAAVRIKRYLENTAANDKIKDTDYMFIDESQDMLPVELEVLKKLTTHAVILAGDGDQSIYQARSPYSRGGFQLRGNTRVLHTNFRNTIPIHKFAETFRKKSLKEAGGELTDDSAAFREGPSPEIYIPKKDQHLSQLLIQKVKVFIEEIGYTPENIAILIPSVKVKSRIEDGLLKAGYSSVWIKDDEFNFRQEGVVRLCPIHSSKGLDFPVVMLYLPFLYPPKNEEEEKKQRNLLYVACTRAMDNLNIFVDPGKNPVLNDLVESFE